MPREITDGAQNRGIKAVFLWNIVNVNPKTAPKIIVKEIFFREIIISLDFLQTVCYFMSASTETGGHRS